VAFSSARRLKPQPKQVVYSLVFSQIARLVDVLFHQNRAFRKQIPEFSFACMVIANAISMQIGLFPDFILQYQLIF